MSGTELEIPESGQVEETPPREEGEHQPSARELMMQKIAENAEAVRQEEIATGLIYDENARDAGLVYEESHEPAEPSSETRTEARTETRTEQPKTEPEPDKNEYKVITTPDGQKLQVTHEQYEHLAQMGMVANMALYQHQYQPQPVPQPVQQQPAPQMDADLFRETVRKIQYGGEEDGAAALQRLVSEVASRQPQPQYIDQQAIVQQAVALAHQQQVAAQEAEIIKREYTEIFADPQRAALAELNVNAIRQRNIAIGRNQADLDVFREAGNAVYDALKLPRPNSETGSPALQAAARTDVLERKRAAPRQTQVIDRRAAQPATPRAPSGADIVDRMRTARGQASMM